MTRVDPLFGELHSAAGPDGATLLWTGRSGFPPTGDIVDYQFNAPKDGPTEAQRDRAIWIPARDEVTMEWDLTFEDPETAEQYMVDLRGWTPVGVAPA